MEIMTTKELAKYLRINVWVIYEMVKKNEIPYFKIRTNIRFSKEAIREFINKAREANNGY